MPELLSDVSDVLKQVILDNFTTLDGKPVNVFDRVLTPTDPNFSFGIDLVDWTPEGAEIGSYGDLLSRYEFNVYYLHTNLDRADGAAHHRKATRNLRLLLAKDPSLKVLLGALQEPVGDSIERFQRLKVTRQVFRDTGLGQGAFLFLSLTYIQIETETT